MYKSDARLFGLAVVAGLSNRYEKELAENTESPRCSEVHTSEILDIVSKAIAVEHSHAKRRLIAILVAASLLLLVGCTAFVYRNEIGSFVEHVYEEYINIELPDNGEGLPTEIEYAYTLSYMPEGYILTDEVIEFDWVRYEYMNDLGEKIIFEQMPKSISNIGVDNDGGDADVFMYRGVEIYLRTTEKKKHYIWAKDNDAFSIICIKTLSQDEILKIIDGME